MYIYIYIYIRTSIKRNILTIKHREVGQDKDLSAPRYLCLIHRYFKLTYQPPSLHKPKVFSYRQKSEEYIEAAQT